MAGPTSSILLNFIPSTSTWSEIQNTIQSISDKVEGSDFQVISTKAINGTVTLEEGHPFGIEKHRISEEYYDYTEEEVSMIREYIGFDLQYDLGIYAMCNQEVDHRILGELTLYWAETFNGLIDFGGQLNDQVASLKGNLWEVPYETAGGFTAIYHLSDALFMKEWLNHPYFRMVK